MVCKRLLHHDNFWTIRCGSFVHWLNIFTWMLGFYHHLNVECRYYYERAKWRFFAAESISVWNQSKKIIEYLNEKSPNSSETMNSHFWTRTKWHRMYWILSHCFPLDWDTCWNFEDVNKIQGAWNMDGFFHEYWVLIYVPLSDLQCLSADKKSIQNKRWRLKH